MEDLAIEQEEKIKYSKFFSSLFCTCSIILLSILSILTNLSMDLYSMITLLKVVVPASFSFWFLGFVIGTILDKYNTKIIQKAVATERKVYDMPSMFAGEPTQEVPTEEIDMSEWM